MDRISRSRLSKTPQSHLVLGHDAAFVDPLSVSVLHKGEGKKPTIGVLGWLRLPSPSPQLGVCGAARQQAGRGGSWCGGSPDVQRFPLWAGWETLAQVAGAGAGRGRQSALAAVQAAGVVLGGAFA